MFLMSKNVKFLGRVAARNKSLSGTSSAQTHLNARDATSRCGITLCSRVLLISCDLHA